MNRVISFTDRSMGELADIINRFCKDHNYKPISISMVCNPGYWYEALVIVEG